MDEEDEYAEVDQRERERHGDREVRYEVAGLPCDTDPSASTAYTNVATNVPSVIWVPRSRMELRSIRGPNCVDASVRATIVIEKTTPTTVMIGRGDADEDLAGGVGRAAVHPAGKVMSPSSAARSSA